jgi:hypothetical protein
MESSSQSSGEREALKKLTLVCLEGYTGAAVNKMIEAENLFLKGLELRDEAKALFARANELALEYARESAKLAQVLPYEDDIAW